MGILALHKSSWSPSFPFQKTHYSTHYIPPPAGPPHRKLHQTRRGFTAAACTHHKQGSPRVMKFGPVRQTGGGDGERPQDDQQQQVECEAAGCMQQWYKSRLITPPYLQRAKNSWIILRLSADESRVCVRVSDWQIHPNLTGIFKNFNSDNFALVVAIPLTFFSAQDVLNKKKTYRVSMDNGLCKQSFVTKPDSQHANKTRQNQAV